MKEKVMTTSPVIDRPEAPAGPAKLSPAQLRAAQTETLTGHTRGDAGTQQVMSE
jgi:hypothetical protein